MVRTLFIVILALFALGTPAFAWTIECEDCDLYLHGVKRQVIPTDNLVCIYFVQPKRGNVLLRLQLKDGGTRPYTKKNARTRDRICVGRHWIAKLTETMYICDEFNHAAYTRVDVEVVARKPTLSREKEACLFGKDECGRMGYPTR